MGVSKMTNPLNELSATAERVRAGSFPTLSAALVGDILQIEAECVENRSEALRRVGERIQAYLDSQGA